MKIKMQLSPSFNRSLLALSLGCALACLPAAVRAQDAPDATTPAADASAPAAAPTGSDKFSAGDKAIVTKFANGNEGEVELAKIALTNAESQDVKDFAQKMIDDHGKANQDLTAVASAHGTELKPELDAKEKALSKTMMAEKGTKFDKAYVKHAVADHTEDVAEYKKAQKSLKDKDLLAYDEKTLPTVEEHLKMAKDMESKMGVGETKSVKKSKKG